MCNVKGVDDNAETLHILQLRCKDLYSIFQLIFLVRVTITSVIGAAQH